MAKVGRYWWRLVGVGAMLAIPAALLLAQKSHQLVLLPVKGDSAALAAIKLKTTFASPQQCADYLAGVPKLLQSKGWPAASVDTFYTIESQTFAKLYMGPDYQLTASIGHNQTRQLLQMAGMAAADFKDISLPRYRLLQNRLLNYFESSGFPFATMALDSVAIAGSTISAVLQLDKGPFYRFDSVRVLGPARISRNFIHRYLDIEQGSPYNSQKLAAIDQRLLELPYLQQVQPWDVTMLNTGSMVNLYLAPKKSNQVNVLAGFLPDNRQLGGGKLLFTIDANLQLQNALGSGEKIGLVWQQIQPQSPRLNLLYQQPYLFSSPFGLDVSFDLFKKDSIFLNINAQLGMRYTVSGRQAVKLGIQSLQTNVLQLDTLALKNSRALPDIADVRSLNLLATYELNTTNYRLNPSKGTELHVQAGVGSKRISKNNTVLSIKDPAFNYASLYDTVTLNTYQMRLKGALAHYSLLARQAVLKTGLQAGWYQSPNYFRNELFQVGGYKLLRGFDEESIFANQYAVVTAEFRYLLGLNSYFFGFGDVGWTRFQNASHNTTHHYWGTGLGLAFETRGGIFNLSYALGKRNDLPLNVRQSKIHIGYVSVF